MSLFQRRKEENSTVAMKRKFVVCLVCRFLVLPFSLVGGKRRPSFASHTQKRYEGKNLCTLVPMKQRYDMICYSACSHFFIVAFMRQFVCFFLPHAMHVQPQLHASHPKQLNQVGPFLRLLPPLCIAEAQAHQEELVGASAAGAASAHAT